MIYKQFSTTTWIKMQEFMFDKLQNYSLEPKSLSMIRYQMESGGKRLRPLIVTHTNQAFGGIFEDAFNLAITIEIIHNASLVHDDIEDKDKFRRGKKTLWAVFSEEQAINIGDLMFALGLKIFMDSKISEHRKCLIINEINKSIIGITNGQILDVDQKQNSIHNVDEYFKAIDGKTGSLFVLAFVGGGLVAKKLNNNEYEILNKIGISFGRLFQIRDDMIDALGLKEGRQAGRDIIEGKMSLPAVLAIEKLSSTDKNRLLQIHKMPFELKTKKIIKEALLLYNKANIFDDIQKLYIHYQNEIIQLSEINPQMKNLLTNLLDSLKIDL